MVVSTSQLLLLLFWWGTVVPIVYGQDSMVGAACMGCHQLGTGTALCLLPISMCEVT